MADKVYIEDEIGKKWDRCLTDGIIKLGSGLILGSVISLLFFKRRKWPIIAGGAFGIGMAYSHCEQDLNQTLSISQKVKLDSRNC